MNIGASNQRVIDGTNRQLDSVRVHLTAKQVAERLGISIKTLRRWVAAGTFPQPRRMTARLHRWDVSAVAEFLNRTPDQQAE